VRDFVRSKQAIKATFLFSSIHLCCSSAWLSAGKTLDADSLSRLLAAE